MFSSKRVGREQVYSPLLPPSEFEAGFQPSVNRCLFHQIISLNTVLGKHCWPGLNSARGALYFICKA